MSLDASVIALVLNRPERLQELLEAGITSEVFSDDFKPIWNFILRMKRQHGEIPSRPLMETRYPDVYWPAVRTRDFPILVHQLHERKRMNDFLALLLEASRQVNNPEDVPEVISHLMGGLNTLQHVSGQGKNHLVDLLGKEYQKRIVAEIRSRRAVRERGIQTGLATFDEVTGGLQPQEMITVIARTAGGKSWLNLLFVAMAVTQGKKVILYPLEMSLDETAMRLYTIFSQKIFGGHRVLSNVALSRGRVSKRDFMRLLGILEEQYEGRLLVADVGLLASGYTLERIEAECELYHPDMFWVDYLTLLQKPQEAGQEDWQSVSLLSKGIKGIAMRHHLVGGCSAQVSREHLKSREFCPRLEHISFGDSIGHDSDKVFSLHKQRDKLWYALRKNRSGPEIERVACRFLVDQGIIEELSTNEEPKE